MGVAVGDRRDQRRVRLKGPGEDLTPQVHGRSSEGGRGGAHVRRSVKSIVVSTPPTVAIVYPNFCPALWPSRAAPHPPPQAHEGVKLQIPHRPLRSCSHPHPGDDPVDLPAGSAFTGVLGERGRR